MKRIQTLPQQLLWGTMLKQMYSSLLCLCHINRLAVQVVSIIQNAFKFRLLHQTLLSSHIFIICHALSWSVHQHAKKTTPQTSKSHTHRHHGSQLAHVHLTKKKKNNSIHREKIICDLLLPRAGCNRNITDFSLLLLKMSQFFLFFVKVWSV